MAVYLRDGVAVWSGQKKNTRESQPEDWYDWNLTLQHKW